MFKYWFTILILFTLDRLSKVYILQKPSVDGFFALHMNEDIAFSLPMINYILYPVIIIIIVFLIALWLKSLRRRSVLIWPWGLIIIGAISNLLDRINYGAVVDFINVPLFTVLNLSDIYISVGIVWILYYEIIYKKRLTKAGE